MYSEMMDSLGYKFLVSAVLLGFIGIHVDCKVERYGFHIVEKGTPVNEVLEVDEENKIEVIRVPKHNELDAMELMNDFDAGLSARRAPLTKDCFVFKLDPSLPSPQKLKRDLDQLSRQSLPHNVRTEKTTTRVLGLANRLTLPQRIVDFCGTFPIYKAEEISLDSLNATFYKTQEQGRKKRHHVQLQYHLCSEADELQLEHCLEKTGGFNFRQECKYRTAHCYYIVDCHHDTNTYNRKYICHEIVHRLNVRDICCKAFC